MEQALGLRDAGIELSSPTSGHADHLDPNVVLTKLELEELEQRAKRKILPYRGVDNWTTTGQLFHKII